MNWDRYKLVIVIGGLWVAFMTWRTATGGVLDGLLAPIGIALLVGLIAAVVQARRSGG